MAEPTSTMRQSSYRPDIDGLRAIAVLVVIFFHFGVRGFPGGYVGVDVFFVISGFLITQILVSEHEVGRYSIGRFYERRVRRIIPALLAMLALTLLAGWFFLAPLEYSDSGKSTLSAVTFVSNIKFWKGSGYFDRAAVRPILHTWSLAVEEQFYIIYPLVLALLFRLRRHWLSGAVLLAWLGSFLLSAVGAFVSPSATFFLIPTRAWELMTGAMIALGMMPAAKRPAVAETMAWVGVILLAAPVMLYDERTLFPGLAALPPCLGTALLIHSGADHDTRARRILSWPPIVTVGLMSYSLYLYHFPVRIFAARWALRPLTPVEILGALALTFLLGFLSWRFVERPFRRRDRFNRQQIFAMGLAGSVVVALAAGLIVWTRGVPQRFSLAEREVLSAANAFSPDGLQCLNMPVAKAAEASSCRLGTSRAGPMERYGDFLLVGDSHVAAIIPAATLAASRINRSGTALAFNMCAPLIGVDAPALPRPDDKACRQRNLEWLRLLKDPSIKTVLLTAYWSSHLEVWQGTHGRGADYLAAGLERTLDALAGKQVIIMLDVPHAAEPIWVESVFGARFGRPLQPLISGGDDEASQVIRRVAAGRAQVIDLSAPFCRAGACTLFDRNGRPILADRNHVTVNVAREILSPLIEDGLARTPSQPNPAGSASE